MDQAARRLSRSRSPRRPRIADGAMATSAGGGGAGLVADAADVSDAGPRATAGRLKTKNAMAPAATRESAAIQTIAASARTCDRGLGPPLGAPGGGARRRALAWRDNGRFHASRRADLDVAQSAGARRWGSAREEIRSGRAKRRQRQRQLGGVRVALVPVLLEAALHDLDERRRHGGPELGERQRRLRDDLQAKLGHRLGLERASTASAARRARPPAPTRRRARRRPATSASAPAPCRGASRASCAFRVSLALRVVARRADFDTPKSSTFILGEPPDGPRQKQVLGLEIAMDDPGGVGFGDGLAHLRA